MRLQNPSTAFRSISFLCVVSLLYSLSLVQPTTVVLSAAVGNETDRLSLLKFKESISNDPHGVLSSWNDSVHFCGWRGVSCSRKHQRITTLNLSGYNLGGTVSPYVGNFSFLRILNLGNNSFFGEIPQQVGRLFRMQHLNLSHNMLEGKIPVNLSYCLELKVFDLGTNRLIGDIPLELGSLVKLEILDLGSNNLTGGVPSFFGNISSLTWFSVGYNNLAGTLPGELGRLKKLTVFSIGPNHLSGVIPPSLYNTSSMRTFAVVKNGFYGTLPPTIGLTLPNLQEFLISENEFSGKIPESISNASQLQVFDIPTNSFVGQVPESLGNLPDLWWLSLGGNYLGNYSANSLDFIVSLINCSKLEMLSLEKNNFGGILPDSVANLSTKLTVLHLGVNRISGHIPAGLQNLVNLTWLSMYGNLLTGDIPASLAMLPNLRILDLQENTLSGKIPISIGNLTKIFQLNLSHNKLKGSIPPSIGDCQNLQFINMSSNSLSGGIPKQIFSLRSSIKLELSHNSLNGDLPIEVGNLKHISLLDLRGNNFIGEIPETIGHCESMEYLYLGGNFFQGPLPSQIASLKGLQYLDVSLNDLTGQIPKGLAELPFLVYLNMSFNDLEGEVPSNGIFRNTSAVSVVGNTKLCGGVSELQLPGCSEKGKISGFKLTIVIVCSAVVFLLFLGSVVLYYWRKSQRKSSTPDSTVSLFPEVSYKSLYRGTDGFSTSMLIGRGSFGSVYKGTLDQNENLVAVKVLNLQQKGAEKSFLAECNTLRNARHRNLIKILTCCSSIDYQGNEFKALVFEFMPNGGLEKWLHHSADGENRSRGLNMTQRLNVAIDVASAIYYLHDECDDPIIHCDLKPSNVLLDYELVAHVSDFGLARLISNTTGFSDSHTGTTGFKGTIGYVPPEYATCGKPSKKGDVYSYGILVLEMFTKKRPTDEMFKDDFNLPNFVKMALPERFAEVVDSALLPGEVEENEPRKEQGRNHSNYGDIEIDIEDGKINFENPNQISSHLQKCLVSVLEIGVVCSKESPNDRMNMEDVTKALQHIKNAYMSALRSMNSDEKLDKIC